MPTPTTYIQGFPKSSNEMEQWMKKYKFDPAATAYGQKGAWYDPATQVLTKPITPETPTTAPMEGATRINPVTEKEETYKYNDQGQIGWWPTPTEEEKGRFAPPPEVAKAQEAATVTPVVDTTEKDRQDAADEANKLAQNIFDNIDEEDIDVRESTKLLADLKEKIEAGLTTEEEEKPESLADLFKTEKAKLGLDVLETELADLDKDLELIDAKLLADIEKSETRLASKGAISSEQQRLTIEANREKAYLNIERSAVARIINNKLTTLETIMNLSQADMTNASAYYDKQITRATQLYNLVKGVEEAEETRTEKATKNAQFNLTTLTNLFKAFNISFADLTEANKQDLRKLELEAGMPVGITEAFMKAKPKAELLSTITGTDAAGNQIVTFIYKDKDGMPGTMKTVTTAGVKAGEKEGWASASDSDKSKVMSWLMIQPEITDEDIEKLKTDNSFFYWALGQANLEF